MEFMDIANDVLYLLTSFLGLVGTGLGVFFAIKNWIKAMNEKNSKEHWLMIMEMADAAMKEAEATNASGEDKKTTVIMSVNAACIAAGIDTQEFAEQLDQYIDQTIAFIKKMNEQKQLIK